MKRMREHPDKDYAIESLSEETGLSLSALSETFKRAAGLPPHAYLIDCRIRKAQELLASGKHSIKAISDMLRFSSTQHFATTYKKITGASPSSQTRPKRNSSVGRHAL